MTIKECQEEHKKLWNWIAEETLKKGEPVSKQHYFDKVCPKYTERPCCDCYACEYDEIKNFYDRRGGVCVRCPIDWRKVSGDYDSKSHAHCCEEYSPYCSWDRLYSKIVSTKNNDANELKKLSDLAREIAELPFKEERDER